MLIACNWVLVLIQKKPGAFLVKTPSFADCKFPSFLAMLTERPVTHARGGAEGGDDGRDDARHNLKCELPSFFSFHSSSNSFKFIDYD